MYMYLLTLGFPIEPIDKPFQFHDTLQGVPVRIHAEKGYAFVFFKRISRCDSRECPCTGINRRIQ